MVASWSWSSHWPPLSVQPSVGLVQPGSNCMLTHAYFYLQNLQSFTQNLESRKNSAISVELKDKDPTSRKSSVDQIKVDTNSSGHSSRQDSLTDVSLTAYHQRKFEAEREYKVMINRCSQTEVHPPQNRLYKLYKNLEDETFFM